MGLGFRLYGLGGLVTFSTKMLKNGSRRVQEGLHGTEVVAKRRLLALDAHVVGIVACASQDIKGLKRQR